MLKVMFGDRFWVHAAVVLAAVGFVFGPGQAGVRAQDSEAEAAYEAAAGLFNLGLWEQAAAAYKEYFKKHPRHTLAGHAHFGLGLCHFNMKDYASAAAELKAATGSKGPDKVEANLYLGQALMLKQPAVPKDAETAFEASLKTLGFAKKGFIDREWDSASVKSWLEEKENEKKKPLAADVFIGLLESTYLQGDWKSVVRKSEAFEGLAKGSGVEQRTRVLAGEAQEQLENFEAAAVAYKAASELKGNDAAEALFRLGIVRLNNLKSFEAAAENFNAFADKYRSNPKRPDAAFNEALCYYQSYFGGKKEHLGKAVETFGGFARTHPQHKMADTAQYYVGRLEHTRENWAATIKALEPLMKEEVDPAFDQLVFLVADSYHRMRNWGKSAELYMKFAKGNEGALNADVALHNAGVSFSNLSKPDTEMAITAYELLDAKCPGSPHLPSARLKLGIIHYEAGRFDEAQKPLAKIPANHPLKADGDYYLAWTELDNKRPAAAAARFEALGERLAKAGGNHRLVPLCRLYQGISEFEGRKFTASAQTLGQFVTGFPEHEKLDEAAFNMGLAQMQLRKWDDAIKSFDIVPKNSAIHDRALYQAAWSQREAGKPAEAIPYYKAFLEQHADSGLANNVALELAEVEFEVGGENGGEDAVARLTKLLAGKPNPDLRRLALYRLGIVQFSRKQYPASAKAFEGLLEDPAAALVVSTAWQAGEARRNMALTASGDAGKAAEYKAALANYQAALAAKAPPNDVGQLRLQQQALLRVGQMFGALEDWKNSNASFQSFIKDNPQHELVRTAYLGMGWSMQNEENYQEAIAAYEKTVSEGVRDDTGARAQFLLGECYFEKKEFEKAIIEFAKVEALYAFPDWQSKAAYEMAQALLRQDKKDRAREQFERLIKRYPDTNAANAAAEELKNL
tara:strand:- start:17615 stop:20353 length:2739 start_codon:yes stop_codon:yes gene_type:complete